MAWRTPKAKGKQTQVWSDRKILLLRRWCVRLHCWQTSARPKADAAPARTLLGVPSDTVERLPSPLPSTDGGMRGGTTAQSLVISISVQMKRICPESGNIRLFQRVRRMQEYAFACL